MTEFNGIANVPSPSITGGKGIPLYSDGQSNAFERSLARVHYQNLAMEGARMAYLGNPTDWEGYRRQLREFLKDFPVPLENRKDYNAILEGTEGRYRLPILEGRAEEEEAIAHGQRLELIGRMAGDAIATLGGKLPPADGDGGTATGDMLSAAIGMATGAVAAGDPEAASLADDINRGAIRAIVEREMETSDDPDAPIEEFVSGDEPLTVKIPTTAGDVPISSEALSPEGLAQLKEDLSQGAKAKKRERAAAARLDRGALLDKFPVEYGGSVGDRHCLDGYGARLLKETPLSADSTNFHGMKVHHFAKKFGYLPAAYVEEIGNRINGVVDGHSAAIWSHMLWAAVGENAAIARQFETGTLVRAQLLSDLAYGQGMAPDEALKLVNDLKNDNGNWERVLAKNKELGTLSQKERSDFYGTKVTPETYGNGGVREYQALVRSIFLTNGNNGKNAREVAKKIIDASYATTKIGHHRRNPMKVKYPPEAYYPDHVIRNVLKKSMANVVIPHIKKVLGYDAVGEENYTLVANDLTAVAFNAEGGMDPAWEVWYVDGHGNHRPVVDKNGGIFMVSLGGNALETKSPEMASYWKDEERLEKELRDLPATFDFDPDGMPNPFRRKPTEGSD
jgi:hypothetical protein